jgi:hypothetical protein
MPPLASESGDEIFPEPAGYLSVPSSSGMSPQ